MNRFALRSFICAVVCFTGIPTAYAHPHAWIQLNTQFVLDENDQLISVTQTWEFDAFFSAMTITDLLNQFGDQGLELSEMSTEMVHNLGDYNYFSTLQLDNAEIALNTPRKHSLATTERNGETLLQLEMVFDIESATFSENKMIQWQVYDPTYYVSMLHNSESNVEVVGGSAASCSRQLQAPEPSNDLVAYAQSLDQTQRDTAGLGVKFAETVVINCN
ncbi:MAG: DUF1007 family protein [Pseudomonadota bacterium]